jgi:hypothetical protein
LHPLVRKTTSTRSGSYKIRGRRMKIDYIKDAKAVELEEVIIGLNTFIAQFDIRGGTHHGYIREFNCGDHPSFAWDLGGRLYSVGDESLPIPVHRGQSFRRIADSVPVIADSC